MDPFAILMLIAIGIPTLIVLATEAFRRDPYTREYVMDRVKHLDAIGDVGPEFQRLCQMLAEMDGVRYSGTVYFRRCIMGGEKYRDSRSEALHLGGLAALRAYNEVMERPARQEGEG
jgi:hypothetical protein